MTIFLPTSYNNLVPCQMVHNGNESTCRLLGILGSLTSLSTACKSWWNHSFLVVMNQPVGCRPSSGHSRLRSFSGDCSITPTKAATWHSSLPSSPSFWFLQFFQVSSLDWIVNIGHAVSWSCNALVNFGIWLWSCVPLILWVPPNIKLLSHRWKLFFNRILLRLISTAVGKVANHWWSLKTLNLCSPTQMTLKIQSP